MHTIAKSYPPSRPKRLRLRQLVVAVLLVLLFFASTLAEPADSQDTHDAEQGNDDDEEEEEYWTATELLRFDVGIDYMAIHDDSKDTTGSGQLDLHADDPSEAARQVLSLMEEGLHERLTKMYTKAKTPECRAKIAEHMTYFVNAFGTEKAMPFADVKFTNTCPEPVYEWDNLPPGMHIGMVQNRTYQPPRGNETADYTYMDDPNDLRILYAILTHDSPTSTIRLIETLYEPGHVFVIHVDGKETSDETHHQLETYAKSRDHVHVLANERRVRINWGGFTMVNATLQILRYAFAIDEQDQEPLEFHKVFHVASTSYPLASNTEIRKRITSYPLETNFVYTIMKPTRPTPSVWHYFVECDDALHRIYRLPPLQNATHGVETYTSSQWFIISREFAEYLADPQPGTFVYEFLDYIEHVVVADETFFGTVLRHTDFCTKHHNSNFLHLQFDRWESDLPAGQRDEKKCMMPDPNHCGRSPTTMTIDYVDILELSHDLFARKFVDTLPGDIEVKDIIDEWRLKRDDASKKDAEAAVDRISHQVHVVFSGHGVLVVAKDTINDTVPLCLGLGETGNKPKLVPCFHDIVVPTLEEGWETGAVILEETPWHNRWSVGPCTSDGYLERLPTALMNVTSGNYSSTGPRCQLKQVDGQRSGRCFDSDSGKSQPGGKTQVFPCSDKWYQYLSFGDGTHAPIGSMYTRIPSHIVKQIRNLGHDHVQWMCLGVPGRGINDETDWEAVDENFVKVAAESPKDANDLNPLSDWLGNEIVTTQCTNTGAVIEWLFVPFIVEDSATQNSSSTDNGTDRLTGRMAGNLKSDGADPVTADAYSTGEL